MKPLLLIDGINDTQRQQIGGKAFALARLHQEGFRVPKTVFIPSNAYDAFVSTPVDKKHPKAKKETINRLNFGSKPARFRDSRQVPALPGARPG